MAKMKMSCPISKGACIDCAIYRGRHFYLCFSKEYKGVSLGASQIEELKFQYKKNNDTQDEKFGMPDAVRLSSKWIQNVEDVAKTEDLTKQRGSGK